MSSLSLNLQINGLAHNTMMESGQTFAVIHPGLPGTSIHIRIDETATYPSSLDRVATALENQSMAIHSLHADLIQRNLELSQAVEFWRTKAEILNNALLSRLPLSAALDQPVPAEGRPS